MFRFTEKQAMEFGNAFSECLRRINNPNVEHTKNTDIVDVAEFMADVQEIVNGCYEMTPLDCTDQQSLRFQ